MDPHGRPGSAQADLRGAQIVGLLDENAYYTHIFEDASRLVSTVNANARAAAPLTRPMRDFTRSAYSPNCSYMARCRNRVPRSLGIESNPQVWTMRAPLCAMPVFRTFVANQCVVVQCSHSVQLNDRRCLNRPILF